MRRTAGPRVRVVAYPQALLARVPRDDADDGRPIVGIGAVALALIGASTWRVTGIAMGRAFFPRVLVQLVGLKGRAGHHLGRCGVVQVAWTRWRKVWSCLRDRPNSRAKRAGGFAFGNATQQEYQGGWALTGLFKDGVGQQGIVAITHAATVGWKVALCRKSRRSGL